MRFMPQADYFDPALEFASMGTPGQTALTAESSAVAASMPGLEELWWETQGHPSVRIAVIDGPVDASHPCFGGHRVSSSLPKQTDVPELGFPPTQVSAGLPSAHGTHVASLLFATHGCGIRGMAPQCSGLVLPVFDQAPSGELIPCSQMDLARAIGQAINAGVHIVNISGGELSSSGQATDFLNRAVRQAADANLLIVSAVGNEGCDCLHVPAALPGVLAVGALDLQGRPLGSSNWSESLVNQGIMAPGQNILGALPGGRVGGMTGTSFATPLVSGVAALLLSLQVMRGQRPDPKAVRRALLESVRPCDLNTADDCRRLLAGRLDIPGARARLGLSDGLRARSLVSMAGTVTPTMPFTVSLGSGGAVAPSGWVVHAAALGSVPVSGHIVPSYVSEVSSGMSSGELVFALGELGYDFGSEARLDYFVQQMGSLSAAMNPMCMAKYLQKQEKSARRYEQKEAELCDQCPQILDDPAGHEEDANALLWVLNLDDTPTYAIQPDDQFAAKSYDLLTDFLFDQYFDPEASESATKSAAEIVDEGNKAAKNRERLYRVAIAGRLAGITTLYNGTVVPVIRPVTRGMFNWDAGSLLEAILGPRPWTQQKQQESKVLQGFLRRIYYEMRNLGQSSQERALNFAGTNAYNSGEVFRSAWNDGLRGLESFEVQRSPICRPSSDCWDVMMTFFDPEKPYKRARQVYRYTIDVSDVMPVAVGAVRSWPIFSRPSS